MRVEFERGQRDSIAVNRAVIFPKLLNTSFKVLKDRFDHGWIFDARDHLHRAATVFTSFDIDLVIRASSVAPMSSRGGGRVLARRWCQGDVGHGETA